jgi:hypothetical protein
MTDRYLSVDHATTREMEIVPFLEGAAKWTTNNDMK